MLKEFYSYLSDKIIQYFETTGDIEGYKYSITFENNEQVRGLYDQLHTLEQSQVFEYLNAGEVVYQTFALTFGDKKVIVAATIDHVKTDFLTTLRNSIGTDKAGFDGAGLLIIYDATLDSIANATESFQKEGMPFHIDMINQDIKEILKASDMKKVDQEIIKFEIDRRKNDTYKDSNNIFEYNEVLAVIHKGGLETKDFKEFRLFQDPDLYNLQKDREIKNRLKENNKYFEKVDQSVRFGDVEKDLENTFTDRLIDKFKHDGWEEVLRYKEIEKSIEEKQNIEKIEIKQIEIYAGDLLLIENEDYVVKGKGSIKNQTRNQDVIIFNPSQMTPIKASIQLTKAPNKESIKTHYAEKKVSGRKVEVIFKHECNTCTYEAIRMSDENTNATVRVNICIVDLAKKVLEPILTTFELSVPKAKDKQYIGIKNEDEQIILHSEAEEEESIVIKNHEAYEVNKAKRIILQKTEGLLDEDEDEAYITLDFEGMKLKLCISDETKRMNVLTGFAAWRAKMTKQYSLSYKGENRVVQGTSEYYTRDDFRDNLVLESEIITQGGMCWELNQGKLEVVHVTMHPEIEAAYNKLLAYYQITKQIPSLTYYDEAVTALAKEYIDTIIKVMHASKEETSLPKELRNIMQIGKVEDYSGEHRIRYMPLAPLNVAYQLKLKEVMDETLLGDEAILKKLTPIALLPYIKDLSKELYKPIEQWHSPEWMYYVPNEVKRYKGSRSFVPKLVKEKIEEFVDHFSYLFEQNRGSVIKVSLINTGDCKEVLQGICQYYVNMLKKDKQLEDLNPIQVNVYHDKEVTHAFEEFATYVESDEIKQKFDLNLDTNGRFTERDVINVLRERITFYDKFSTDDTYSYAHITFVEMNQKSDTGIGKMSEINTGVSLNGLISGVPSVHYSDSYRTGYGMRFIEEEDQLIALTKILNSVGRVAHTSDPYYSDQCITTELDRKDEENLEKIYNASNWITFIEPKVDLNFFKTSETSKDLLIIHYSDQYTTASGYDAITVTRKSRQYQSIIEEHLAQKGITNAEQYTPAIINMFNAVNGDWLLRLISTKSHFDREKISILSAIKLALAYYYHKDIVWVPISLEEILRVSGGAGLKKNEGIFSAKNLGFENNGATSDDIMLIGLEDRAGELCVHYHPLEVKIGINAPNYIEKAIQQVTNTKQIFVETLMKEELDLKTKIYRNFMMQLVMVSIEKLKLYHIWDEQDWDKIANTELRRKLLNEDYTIVRDLESQIGLGGVVSFKKDLQFRNVETKQDVTILEFTEEDGINYITKGISEIRELILNDYKDLDGTQRLEDHNEEAIVPEEGAVIVEDNTNEAETATVEVVCEEPVEPLVQVPTTRKESMEVLFGTNQANNQSLIWYPNDTDKVFHTNTGIIGTMGTGKTQFTKSLITQLYREGQNNLEGKPLGILIFDYKGDYNQSKHDFIEATNAKVYDLYQLPYNPLALMNIENAKPLLPLHTASSLKETLAKGFNLGQVQSNLLKELIMEAYEAKGIHKVNKATWDRPAPTLKDVYNIYINQEDLKKDSLYAAFSNLIEFEIFEPDATKTKPLFDLIDGVTVINLAGYDESVQNLVVAITLDLFYSQMQACGHSKIEKNIRQLSKIILVDEADNFISKDFDSLKKILKEGREFGVGTVLSTQLLSHFSTSDNDFANYILTWVVHNVADLSTKDVKFIFNTHSKSEEEELYNKIKSLKKHYSIVKMGNNDKALHIRDKAFWELEK